MARTWGRTRPCRPRDGIAPPLAAYGQWCASAQRFLIRYLDRKDMPWRTAVVCLRLLGHPGPEEWRRGARPRVPHPRQILQAEITAAGSAAKARWRRRSRRRDRSLTAPSS